MVLILSFDALLPSHLCVASLAFIAQQGLLGTARMAAINDGAPPGVPVS